MLPMCHRLCITEQPDLYKCFFIALTTQSHTYQTVKSVSHHLVPLNSSSVHLCSKLFKVIANINRAGVIVG